MSKTGRKKKTKEDRNRKRRSWERERDTIENFKAKAPQVKSTLRQRGCELPFYDYLDSYEGEFQRIADLAKTEHASLLGIHEVDEEAYSNHETVWSKLGYADLERIQFDVHEDVRDYEDRAANETLCGVMSAFLDSERNLRSVIVIRRAVKIPIQHREYKYAWKLATLLHEVGHVHDLEQGINFDVPGKLLDLLEAEVFANLYCLEHLADRNLLQSFQMVETGLRDAIPKGGFLAEVAQEVFVRVPPYQLTDWQQVLDSLS